VFGLQATAAARHALRSLRDSNAELFSTVVERLEEIRRGDGPEHRLGQAFQIDNVGLARLLTFYDFEARADLAVVWRLDDQGEPPSIILISVEYVSNA